MRALIIFGVALLACVAFCEEYRGNLTNFHVTFPVNMCNIVSIIIINLINSEWL